MGDKPMEVPDLVKGRVVPSTIQAWGERFHREANLDEYFGELVRKIEVLEAENARLKLELQGVRHMLHGVQRERYAERSERAARD